MDDIPLPLQFVALGILLLIGAFFSIAETSLMSVNRYRLRHLMKEGHRGAKLANSLLARTDKLLGVILLGNNLANAASATLVTLIAVELFGEGEWVLAAGTLSVTFAILVFGEITPKVIAAAYPEPLAIVSSYILYPLLKIVYPAVWFVNLFVRAFLGIMRLKPEFTEAAQAISMEELRTIIQDAGNFIPKKHQSILMNLFDLEKITVDDVMTAHTQIETINFDAAPEAIAEQIATSHHTRLPVRAGLAEEVIGILHIRKVLHQVQSADLTPESLREVMTDPYFVPSGTPLYTQLQQFQEKHQRMALVVDEYGELKGLVTLEDILEEIIGEFTTQSPTHSSVLHHQNDGSWLVDGSATLRELNRKLNLHLPLDGPKTLNGLVLEHFEDIPEPGTSFRIAEHTLEIVQAQDKVVKSIRITP